MMIGRGDYTMNFKNLSDEGGRRRTFLKYGLAVCAALAVVVILGGGCLANYVVTVNSKHYSKKQFYEEMEHRFGMETLRGIAQRQAAFEVNDRRNLVSEEEVEQVFDRRKQEIAGQMSGSQNLGASLQMTDADQLFQIYLNRDNLREQNVRDDVKYSLVIDRMVRTAAVSRDELEQFYDENKLQFVKPPVSSILMIDHREKKELEKARARILNGEFFEQVAREVASHPALRQSGGRVRPIVPQDPDPQNVPPRDLIRFAFSEPIGNVSESFQTDFPPGNFNWKIIRVVARKDAPWLPSLAEVREEADFSYRRQVVVPRILRELASAARVQVHWDGYKKLEEEYGSGRDSGGIGFGIEGNPFVEDGKQGSGRSDPEGNDHDHDH